MLPADNNGQVQLLARDDPRQAAAATAAVARGACVSKFVLAVARWVLDAIYERTPKQLIAALDLLQDADVVAALLTRFRARPALGFSDCLVFEIALKDVQLPLAAFDKALDRLPGGHRL
jgi:hypothetical protein